MLTRLAGALLLVAGVQGCLVYEYEHELWLKVDGSGTVFVTGRPPLWTAFKGLERPAGDDDAALRQVARDLFERSGLEVRRVTLTRRGGRPYLFVAAEFSDVNALAGSPAFPDLGLSLRPDGERLRLEGWWRRPPGSRGPQDVARDGLMAVRFHLPSKVYEHRNAAAGVERGNIVSWRQELAAALDGERLEVGALVDRRSILSSTVAMFAAAVAGGLGVLGLALYLALRRGRRQTAASTEG